MIDHPFVGDLSDKKIDELQTTMASLSGKLNFAHRTHNYVLANQIQMVLQTYRDAYNKKVDEEFKKFNIEDSVNVIKRARPD